MGKNKPYLQISEICETTKQKRTSQNRITGTNCSTGVHVPPGRVASRDGHIRPAVNSALTPVLSRTFEWGQNVTKEQNWSVKENIKPQRTILLFSLASTLISIPSFQQVHFESLL